MALADKVYYKMKREQQKPLIKFVKDRLEVCAYEERRHYGYVLEELEKMARKPISEACKVLLEGRF